MATVNDVLAIAAGQIGYDADDDDLLGSKYGRWMSDLVGDPYYAQHTSAVPWCAMFVTWVFYQAGLICPGMPTAACKDIMDAGRAAGMEVGKYDIVPGDLVIFDWNDGGISTDHIGIVKSVGSSSFQAIEGNTAVSETNGNLVAEKTRYYANVLAAIRPPYDGVSSGDDTIRAMQLELNVKLSAFGLPTVAASGYYNQQTQAGLARLLQASHNHDFVAGLTVDGWIGDATVASMNAHPVAQDEAYEEAGNDAWVVKAMLVGLGAELDLTHWDFDSAATAALNAHKAAAGVAADGICRGADLLTLAPLVATATSGGTQQPTPEPTPDPEPTPEPEEPEDDDSWVDLVSTPADIANMQAGLNTRLAAFGLAGVSATGAYDAQTQRGLVRLLQASHNVDFSAGLTVDGWIGSGTAASMSAHPVGQGGETYGNDCWVVKAMLVGNGWVLDLSNWDIGSRELTAISMHKPYHGLPATPVCDGATLRSLAPAASV